MEVSIIALLSTHWRLTVASLDLVDHLADAGALYYPAENCWLGLWDRVRSQCRWSSAEFVFCFCFFGGLGGKEIREPYCC